MPYPTLRPLFVVVLSIAMLAACKPAPKATAPDKAVLTALQRGINLGMWTGETEQDAIHAAQVHPDDADLQRIRALGFTHVRITFDLAWLADEKLKVREARLTEMQGDLARVRDQGLFVVLSMQPSSTFKKRLASEELLLRDTAQLWRTVAKSLSSFTPQQIAYELINEPEVEDATRVRHILTTLAAGIRKAAPQHVLVIQGPRFSDVEDLVRLTPLDDRNVVYSFHFYEPKNFTHQGVPYGWPMWGLLADLPYPSSPEAVEPALAFMTFEAIEHARYYGQQHWNRDKLAAAIAPAKAWGKQHGVALWCSEFGAFRYKTKPQDRAAWLADTRELLQASDIGWTLWDYAGYFGLVSGPQGQRVLDRNAAHALQLALPGD